MLSQCPQRGGKCFSYGQESHFRFECLGKLMPAALVPTSLRKAASGRMPTAQAEDDLATEEIITGIIQNNDTGVRALFVMIALLVFLHRLFAELLGIEFFSLLHVG